MLGASERVAAATIRDALAEVTLDRVMPPTVPQIEFAKSRELDVSKDSFRVAFAKIQDRLADENEKAVRHLGLRPGLEVVLTISFEINGETKTTHERRIISSIHSSGRVYFKHTTGHFAYASQLSLPQDAGHRSGATCKSAPGKLAQADSA